MTGDEIRLRSVPIAALLAMALMACATRSAPPHGRGEAALEREIVHHALDSVGSPYRWGGETRAGFDCSGLVIDTYRRAGLHGLPHSAAALADRATPVGIDDLQPGDLLFFRHVRGKPNHVAIYIGDRSFVHAPSSGKRVEQVSFDDVYWGPRVRRAGRLLD